jgi:CBS domain-containing protein
MPLEKALKKTSELDIEYLPVVESDDKFAGVLNARTVRRRLSTIILEKQKEADAIGAQA